MDEEVILSRVFLLLFINIKHTQFAIFMHTITITKLRLKLFKCFLWKEKHSNSFSRLSLFQHKYYLFRA